MIKDLSKYRKLAEEATPGPCVALEVADLTSEIKTLREKVEILENTLSDVGFVVDNLHSTSTIDQDTADQLTDAIEGNNTP